MNRIALSLLILSVLVGCRQRQEEQGSTVKFNVDVPIEETDGPRYKKFYDDNRALMAGEQLPLKVTDLILVKLSAAEKAAIDAAHSSPVTVVCDGNKCKGKSTGSEVTTSLDLEEAAGSMWLAEVVELEFQFRTQGGQELIEICKASGMKFKQGFLWAPFDGALVRYDAANPGKIVGMMVDVGLTGSYPNDDCAPSS